MVDQYLIDESEYIARLNKVLGDLETQHRRTLIEKIQNPNTQPDDRNKLVDLLRKGLCNGNQNS